MTLHTHTAIQELCSRIHNFNSGTVFFRSILPGLWKLNASPISDTPLSSPSPSPTAAALLAPADDWVFFASPAGCFSPLPFFYRSRSILYSRKIWWIVQILADLNLAALDTIHQTVTCNFQPNFPAIQYYCSHVALQVSRYTDMTRHNILNICPLPFL